MLPKRMIIGIAGELVKGVPIVAKYEREKSDEKIGKKEIKQKKKQGLKRLRI